MILDGHIHISDGQPDAGAFTYALEGAAIDGGILISQAPPSFDGALKARPPTERLDNLLAWCTAGPQLYPFYWIDPLETDALEQVDLALSRGVAGFKVICDHFYPGRATLCASSGPSRRPANRYSSTPVSCGTANLPPNTTGRPTSRR